MADTKQEAVIPHLLLLPFPTQGHIIPMFKLSQLLHHRGFHITFLNIDTNHHRILQALGLSGFEGLIPNYRFASIPDGLSLPDKDATPSMDDIIRITRTTLLNPFKEFVSGLSSQNVPPVTCIIVDGFMHFAFEVAQQFSIPTVQFVILGAGSILPWYFTNALVENGLLPLKDESCFTNGYLETVVNCIPELEGIPLRSISQMLLVKDLNDDKFNGVRELCDKSIKADSSAIIFNTFEDLESNFIQQLSSLYSKPVLSIGPIHLLTNQVEDKEVHSFGANLWKQEKGCLKWLDSKQPNSVLYVSFGSVACLTEEQITELALGLANSNHNFLWVIRPDLVKGNGKAVTLPPGFETEVIGRGCLTSWCPQEAVIQHPAIGGFLTQCGWNSLLESMSAGLPMLCLPDFAEQVTNTWLCKNKWGIGLEINKDNFTRHEVENLVKEFMSVHEGGEMKKNAMEWKKKAEEACAVGSSRTNLEKLVEILGSLKSSNV